MSDLDLRNAAALIFLSRQRENRRCHRGHGGSKHVGRLRIRAAKILSENFPEWDVYPEDVIPATGSWRTDIRNDVYRWELFTRLKRRNSSDGSELPVVCGCWLSLTAFVKEAAKNGCHLTDGEITVGKKE